MESISILDIYKIGVGPSSSHTLGPWRAALAFRENIKLKNIDKIEVQLFGSLSKTGKGHSTDIAVILGLLGLDPIYLPTENIPKIIEEINSNHSLNFNNKCIYFDPKTHIVFQQKTKKSHPNTLTFEAFYQNNTVASETYYSIGGGFIEQEGKKSQKTFVELPYPIEYASDLLEHIKQTGKSISQIVLENESHFRTQKETESQVNNIFETMVNSVYRGCTTTGILPGGLKVKRRASDLCIELLEGKTFQSIEEWKKLIRQSNPTFVNINKWISCFALAVNEENAAMGRVVTSPTNGASGVIPAVLLYYEFFCEKKTNDYIIKFFCTSGEIGSMFKKKSTISAAVGGCQAEIGVSSAMAAAGLAEIMSASPNQILMAAEIAMEHHLGLTCDPVGGLVQIPCIERNAMGAIKAITACNLALSTNPEDSKVKFDDVVKTMWDTAQAMNGKYKETAEGGLAINIPINIPEC